VRDAPADVVPDEDGVHALEKPASVDCFSVEPLVNITNRLGKDITDEVSLRPSSKSDADLYVGGTNVGDTATVSTPDGSTSQVSVYVTDCNTDVAFDVNATGKGILVRNPNRTVLLNDYLRWVSTSDWDAAVSENGTVHEGFGDRRSDLVYLGYPSFDRNQTSLTTYYPLDGTTGNATDATGNGHDGTIVSATRNTEGILNATSYEFSGNEDRIIDPDAASYLNGLSSFTISAWIKSDLTGTNRGVLHGQDPAGTDDSFGFRYDADGFENGCTNCIKAGIEVGGQETVLESSDNTQTTGWQHVVVKWSSGDPMQLFLNGTEDTPSYTETRTGTLTGISTAPSGGLYVGQGAQDTGGSDGWDGNIDEVRIYDRELTDEEARSLYDLSQRGNITTDWKRFSASQNVTELKLTSVNATFNGGDINVTVESDTDNDGNPEESSTKVDLNGSGGPYKVDGILTDNDRFRLDIELSTPNVTESPCLSGVELSTGSDSIFGGVPCGNAFPTANFSFTPSLPEVSDIVKFNATNSTDPDGSISSYDWDFGDGTTGTGQVTTHSYAAPGTYKVTLTVTDDDGATDTELKNVTVFGRLAWFSPLDWDSAVTENGTVHEDFGDHTSDTFELGYPSVNIWDTTPEAYYPLDEDSGTTAIDVTKDNNGSNKGATVGEDGILNTTSYRFNSTQKDTVDVPDSQNLSNISEKNSFTVNAWVNTTAGGENPILTRFDDLLNGSYDWATAVRDGNLSVFLENNSVNGTITLESQDDWQEGSLGNTAVEGNNLTLGTEFEQEHGVVQTPSSPGQKTVTTGFRPDLIEFRITATNENFDVSTEYLSGSGGGEFGWGHGWAHCPTSSSCTEVAQSTASGSDSPNGQSSGSTDSYSIFQLVTDDQGDSFQGYINGTVSGTNPNGFEITFNSTEQTEYISYTAYRFPDSTDINVGFFTTPTSTGTQSYNVGFEPNYLQTMTGPAVQSINYIEQNVNQEFGWSKGWAIKNATGNIEQQVMAEAKFANNIDDHVFVSSDSQVISPLWSNKGSIDGRINASLASFDSTGFNLDYTTVNPDTADGNSFLITYAAVNTSLTPDIGYGTTPTSTGIQTVNTDANLSSVSLLSSNTIPGINVEGYSGSNLDVNHWGWMYGGGTAAEQRSIGFSSHSNSVNGHASASSGSDAFRLAYSGRDGNILGADIADITGFGNNNFELNWSSVTTTATTNVKYNSVLYFYYGFGGGGEFVENAEYFSQKFDLGNKAYWVNTSVDADTPAGTSFDINYSDGTGWYDSLNAVPNASTLRYNVTLETTNTKRPKIRNITTSFRATEADLLEKTDTGTEFNQGSFDSTKTNGNGEVVLDDEIIGEAGTFTTTDGNFVTVSFKNSYTDPVVVGTTNTKNSPENALTFDARSVTSNSAEMRVCEAEGVTASGCDAHPTETAGYVVIDAAVADRVQGIEAGTFDIDSEIDTTTQTVTYTESFSSAPVVLANVQSTNGRQPVETRVTTTSTGSFEAGICNPSGSNSDSCDSTHIIETVGWVSIEPGELPFLQTSEAGQTGTTVANSQFESQTFTESFPVTPVVVASTQTENGPQETEVDEARQVTQTSVDVRYCETENADNCDSHTDENVGWLAVEDGTLSVPAQQGNYTSSTFDAGRVVDWSGVEVKKTGPLGTNVTVNYTDGTNTYSSIDNVPDSRFLTFKADFNRTPSAGGTTPVLDRVNITYTASGWRDGDAVLNDESWHTATVTYDNGTLDLYSDGVLDKTFSVDSNIGDGNATYQIGGDDELETYLDGRLEEIRVYDEPLGPSNVSDLYEPGDSGNLTTGWKSFPANVNVSSIRLRNVIADLSGGSVNVTVGSDTDSDGTPEERSDPVTLNGSGGPYAVTGLSADSDRFRLELTLNTTDVKLTPEVSRLEIAGK
jgi:hypothetical protein